MDLKTVMEQRSFVIVGDTENPQKFAAQIKTAMQENGYRVQSVDGKGQSLHDTQGEIDVIDLCIRPERGLALLQENRKPCKAVVLQPGAGSEEIRAWLRQENIPYLDDCLLVGLRTYRSGT